MVLQWQGLFGPTRKPGDSVQAPVVFFDDFIGAYMHTSVAAGGSGHFATTADRGVWRYSAEAGGTGPLPVDNADGGWVQIVTDADDNDHAVIQVNGEMFFVEEGRELIFETRLKLAAVTSGDFLVGLSVNSTDPVATVPSDFIAFRKGSVTTGDAALECVADSGSTGTTATVTSTNLVADTFITLSFEYDGKDTVRFFADGSQVHKTSTTVPKSTYLSPILAFVNSTDTAITATIDYVLVANQRAVDQGN
jgi:hypothetical protein